MMLYELEKLARKVEQTNRQLDKVLRVLRGDGHGKG